MGEGWAAGMGVIEQGRRMLSPTSAETLDELVGGRGGAVCM